MVWLHALNVVLTFRYFMSEPYIIPAKTRIGHVHLKVANLQRAEDFYCGLLGFAVTARYGTRATFISAGGYHHHIGLHTAILFEERRQLAVALKRLLDAGYPLTGASDHGVSEAIYLDDPDGNGVELYWDRPAALWPHHTDGSLEMYTKQLDVQGLLATIE